CDCSCRLWKLAGNAGAKAKEGRPRLPALAGEGGEAVPVRAPARAPPPLDRDKVMKHFADELTAAVHESGGISKVWFPRGRIVLGREAGRALRELLRQPVEQPYDVRSRTRTPLKDIAGLIRYRLQKRLGKPPSAWAEVTAMDFETAVNTLRTRHDAGTWLTLLHSCLP
ncbi:Egln3, partial [Symbiodinium necroappetens]